MRRLDERAFVTFLVLLLVFPLALIFLCLDSKYLSDHYCPNCGAFLGTETKEATSGTIELDVSSPSPKEAV